MQIFNFFEQSPALFALFLVWSLAWKGVALWKSARASDKWWFIVMLVVNLGGLVEIFYIFAMPHLRKKKEPVVSVENQAREEN